MGYIRHHAIIVTTWDIEKLEVARKKAKELFGKMVSKIVKSELNGYCSFFIPPDGSKEGWADSERGDENRKKLIEFIETLGHDDGSSSYDYVEVFYGDDEGESKIINHN